MSKEPREQVTQLGQLDLYLPFPRVSAAGENIQNELGPIDDFDVRHLGDRSCLCGSKILVENDQVGALLERAHHHLFQFPFAEHVPFVALLGALDDTVEHANAGRFGQLTQLFQVLFLLGATSGRCAHQNCGFRAGGYRMVSR